jgi:hypothetical protein
MDRRRPEDPLAVYADDLTAQREARSLRLAASVREGAHRAVRINLDAQAAKLVRPELHVHFSALSRLQYTRALRPYRCLHPMPYNFSVSSQGPLSRVQRPINHGAAASWSCSVRVYTQRELMRRSPITDDQLTGSWVAAAQGRRA